MSEDTRREVIKALAYGVDKEEIANMADVDDVIAVDIIGVVYAKDVAEIRRRMEGQA